MFSLGEKDVIYSIPLYGEDLAVDDLSAVHAGLQAGTRPPAASVEIQGGSLVTSLTSAGVVGEVENVVIIVTGVPYHHHTQTRTVWWTQSFGREVLIYLP